MPEIISFGSWGYNRRNTSSVHFLKEESVHSLSAKTCKGKKSVADSLASHFHPDHENFSKELEKALVDHILSHNFSDITTKPEKIHCLLFLPEIVYLWTSKQH